MSKTGMESMANEVLLLICLACKDWQDRRALGLTCRRLAGVCIPECRRDWAAHRIQRWWIDSYIAYNRIGHPDRILNYTVRERNGMPCESIDIINSGGASWGMIAHKYDANVWASPLPPEMSHSGNWILGALVHGEGIRSMHIYFMLDAVVKHRPMQQERYKLSCPKLYYADRVHGCGVRPLETMDARFDADKMRFVFTHWPISLSWKGPPWIKFTSVVIRFNREANIKTVHPVYGREKRYYNHILPLGSLSEPAHLRTAPELLEISGLKTKRIKHWRSSDS